MLDHSSPIKLQVGKGAVVQFKVRKGQVAPAEVQQPLSSNKT